jgi:hypothetical protein
MTKPPEHIHKPPLLVWQPPALDQDMTQDERDRMARAIAAEVTSRASARRPPASD